MSAIGLAPEELLTSLRTTFSRTGVRRTQRPDILYELLALAVGHAGARHLGSRNAGHDD